MRKDFVPVDAAQASMNESAFVEDYWTQQWTDRQAPPDVSYISREEEFLAMQSDLRRLPRGSRLLDGGCGLGAWTLYLSGLGYDTTGVDLSDATIGRLRQWFPDRRFVRGDIRHLDVPDGSYDGYLSWGTFEHFEAGLSPCVAEAHRVLKPGGWLWVTVPFHNGRLQRLDRAPLERSDEHFHLGRGYTTPQRFYQWRLTAAELTRELELHGFRVHRVCALHKDTGVGRWVQRVLPNVRRGSMVYRALVRAGLALAPASYVGHMLFASAERRGGQMP